MSKVAIILDEPNNCSECQFCINLEEDKYCYVQSDLNDENCFRAIDDEIYGSCRQDWCPLKHIPEKEKSESLYDEYDDGYVFGWNSCIDNILRDKEE